jgi:hypothetical protein
MAGLVMVDKQWDQLWNSLDHESILASRWSESDKRIYIHARELNYGFLMRVYRDMDDDCWMDDTPTGNALYDYISDCDYEIVITLDTIHGRYTQLREFSYCTIITAEPEQTNDNRDIVLRRRNV